MLNNYFKLLFLLSIFMYFFYSSSDKLNQSPSFYIFLFITSILLISIVVFFAFKSEKLASNLINKGVELAQSNKSEEAIKVFNKVVRKFGDSQKSNILVKVAAALVNKAAVLAQSNRSEEAIKILDEVVNRFENHKENSILEEVAIALYNKGAILGHINKKEKSIIIYDELISKFKDSKHNGIATHVASALLNKIETNLLINNSNKQNDIDLYENLTKKDNTQLIILEALILLEKAKANEIDEDINSWKNKFQNTSIQNCSFDELKIWAKSFEDVVVKERLLESIKVFENYN
ncbi:tetratricopeptide repeat protein [Poseidonibacter lekithochrous]|uniref:tetratricopeptide repeat protein n=1 Tax=Poseidonibacter lekithochrous TaxID=1904463 RepID=UPI000D3BCB2D|nr:tetratricopeptide repeat protein [Poseidonibacter lekithochrous]